MLSIGSLNRSQIRFGSATLLLLICVLYLSSLPIMKTLYSPETNFINPLPDAPVIHENLTIADFISSNTNSTQNRNLTKASLRIGYPHQICGCGIYKPPNRGVNQSNSNGIASTCSHEATLYGTGQKVRSYTLFVTKTGDGTGHVSDLQLFVQPIEENLKANSEIYPGWITRIYSNISTDNPHICRLICKYETLFWCDIKSIPVMGDLSTMNGRTWRFLPIGDPTVDIFLSRDMDSSVLMRERVAVADWEASNLPFHSMRDHPWMNKALQAGMWGVKNFQLGPLFSSFLQTTLIQAAKANHVYSLDEEILARHVHTPYASRMFLVHDSYHCKTFKDFKTLAFPTQRIEDQTVGVHYIKNVTKLTFPITVCPVECRPKHSKDWTFC